MHKVIETSKRLIDEALRGLSKGYNQLDLDVLGKAVDILKDAETIEAMKGNYQVELKDGKVYSEKKNDDIEYTQIDDNIARMDKHFKKYCEYKKEYQEKREEVYREKCIHELDKFLKSMKDILEELKTSSDFQAERDMIKNNLREMFNMY